MSWRDFKYTTNMELMELKETNPSPDQLIPLIPLIPPRPNSKEPTQELNMFDPEIIKTPKTEMLTEVELEAFNGWYASCRKPEFGKNHEEAMQISWKLVIESMRIIYKEQGKRI